MRKIISIIALTAMCICFTAIIAISAWALEPEPLTVGTDQAYPTLNAAIEHAQDGQVIQIVGDVTETNPANPVIINKSVTIQGGSAVYKITGWTKPASPFQITAEGVTIKDLDIDINGGATIYPLIKTGKNTSLSNASVTLTGTSTAASAPIFVDTSGLKLERVVITSMARTSKIIDLQGNNAHLKEVSVTAGANVTGVYSDSSPANLILEGCSFYTTAGTSKAVSLPSPAGLTLKGCFFAYIGAGTGAGNSGLFFHAPSDAVANEQLTASYCAFNMKSGTGVLLNGYNAAFSGCEFIFDANYGEGINSETPSDADLTFTGCKFYVGKTAGAKITGVNCIVLKQNTGDIKIDTCAVVASDPSISLTSPSAIILNAPDSELNSLIISGSDFAFNVGANNTIGVNAKAIGDLIITGSNFIVDAPSAKCVNAESIGTGRISKSNFAVGTISSAANTVICVNTVSAKSLIIEDESSFTINTKSTGIIAGTKNFSAKDSGFYVDANSARGIVLNDVDKGNISNCKFDIKKPNAIGIGILDSADIHFTGCAFDLSSSGKGINMTTSSGAAAGNVVIDDNIISVKGDSHIVGFLLEHLNSLTLKNTKLQTPGGITASTICIRANHIKNVEIDNLDMIFDSTVSYGIILNETRPPVGEESKVTITNSTANIKEKSTRTIRIFYADGVLVDNYSGKIGPASTNSYLLSLQNSKNVEVKNCDYEGEAAGAVFLAFASGSKSSEESSDFKIHHNNLTFKDKAQGIVSTQANHNVEIYKNTIYIDNSTKGVVIAYGRNNNVYDNSFFANNCEAAIVSDGVDEIASFTPEVDADIYDINGNIIDAYRNKIYNNKLTGSYERGFYISNNGDVVSDNDFSNAAFNYESIPGRNINSQIIIVFCKDVKILDNKFAKTNSRDNQVIRLNNAIISEAVGNITQLADAASEVLFVQGSTDLAPNKIKYPESVTIHDATNTINGSAPVEIVHEWNDPDNLIYEYILKMIETLPIPPTELEPPPQPETPPPQPETPSTRPETTSSRSIATPQPKVYGGTQTPALDEDDEPSPNTYENKPEPIPNPQMGKNNAISLYILGFILLITAGLLFLTGHKKNQ